MHLLLAAAVSLHSPSACPWVSTQTASGLGLDAASATQNAQGMLDTQLQLDALRCQADGGVAFPSVNGTTCTEAGENSFSCSISGQLLCNC